MGDLLEIVTLGGLAIRQHGRPVTGFVSRKVEALFVYLACTRRAYPREVLAEFFWEERPPAQSLANLRTVLNSLRQKLAPYLLITRQNVGLNLDSPFRLDANDLQVGLERANQQWQQPNHLSPMAAAELEQTLALYQGDFLAGFAISDSQTFEDWLLLERERLKHLVIEGLHHLIEYDIVCGAFSSGLTQATRLLQLDPLREDVHRQMMQLLANTGQFSAARRQYDSLRSLLDKELGVEPTPETKAFFENLRVEASDTGTTIRTQLTLSEPLHNLPASTTRFVGRTAELEHIAQVLADPGCRLLTLVGPGGIGKTRLALEAASGQLPYFKHGVYFVSLASVSSPNFMPSTIATALRFSFNNVEDPTLQLVNYLRQKSLLIVLDNFEHLLEGAELVSNLLGHAPWIKVLTTSRERLSLHEEWLFNLMGMDTPAEGQFIDIDHHSAVQLFVQQAKRVRRDFSLVSTADRSAVSRICRLAEGMPLAIELAAAWVRVMPCEIIAGQIADNLDFLTTSLRNIPERHRSLRAVFERSWMLLSAPEREALQRLSVFRGGFTLEAMEQVANASYATLGALVDKSLVQASTSGRFGMHELLRQFSLDKLNESGQKTTVQARHFDFFLALAEDAAPKLHGPEQVVWVERLAVEHDNLRAALQWCRDDEDRVELEMRLASGLLWFWVFDNTVAEGYEWLKATLARHYEGRATVAGAWALFSAGGLAWFRGDFTSAAKFLDESIRIFPGFEDKHGLGNALYTRAATFMAQGKPAAARSACEAAVPLLREAGAGFDLRLGLTNFGEALATLGDDASAKSQFEEALALSRQHGDRRMLAVALNYLGGVLLRQNELLEAQSRFEEAIAIWRELGEQYGLARTLREFGLVTLAQSDYERTAALYEESLALCRETDHQSDIAASLYGLAQAAEGLADKKRAGALFIECLTLYNTAENIPGVVDCLAQLAGLSEAQGLLESATRLLSTASAICNSNGVVQPSVSDAQFDEVVTGLRVQLDEVMFAAIWAEGQTMTVEQAIERYRVETLFSSML